VAGLRRPVHLVSNLCRRRRSRTQPLYYSNSAMDKQINKVEPLMATDRADGEQQTGPCRPRSCSRTHRSAVLYNMNYQYAIAHAFTASA